MSKSIQTSPPDCPECDKLVAVSAESNKIGQFLDWLEEQGIVLAEYYDDGEDDDLHLHHSAGGFNGLLARYYNIDLNKVETEREALLNWIRSVNTQ